MKKYFVQYGDFANQYSLRYAESQKEEAKLVEQGYERVNRADALKLAKAERERKNTNQGFAGYADQYIYPANYNGEWNIKVNGYIVELA